MAKKRWKDLSPGTRKAIIVGGSIDAALRIAALVDLKGRSDDQINGSRQKWKRGLLLVNSAGILPAAYFLKARRG